MRELKIVTVVGARPQFIKAAVLSRIIASENKRSSANVNEVIVHTGQHYDSNMSDVFFRELDIPTPKYQLNVGSSNHGAQTGEMLKKIEAILEKEMPNLLLVYGDTNSTIAGALAASKMHIPIAHVEAGLRSYNKKMPEEINRILTDHVANSLYCPSTVAIENLKNEGLNKGIFLVGDIMYDSILHYSSQLGKSNIREVFDLPSDSYYLATVHRAENTDVLSNLREIISGLEVISENFPVVIALHPRTKRLIDANALKFSQRIRVIEPVSYLEMIDLEKNARAVITDSGGVQKEAFFLETPCITLRNETEWIETVDCRVNILSGPSKAKIVQACLDHENNYQRDEQIHFPYGSGNAGELILESLLAEYAS